jgi:ribosomal-protein-alanine N-acetyltransferase
MTDDLDRIMAVMEAAFDPHWGEAWNRRQVGDAITLPHTHYRLIAPSGATPAEGEPAAGFYLARHLMGEEELLLLAVMPDLRGKGVGRALLDRFKQDAAVRGAGRLFLEMRDNNPAERLYRSAGFAPSGRRPAYYRLNDGTRLDAITFAYEFPTV